MKLALGKLGWSEREYYECSPEGFYYASQGYYAKLQDENQGTRLLSFIVYRYGGGKESIDKAFPIPKIGGGADTPKAPKLPDRDFWEKVKKADEFSSREVIKKKEMDGKRKNIKKRG